MKKIPLILLLLACAAPGAAQEAAWSPYGEAEIVVYRQDRASCGGGLLVQKGPGGPQHQTEACDPTAWPYWCDTPGSGTCGGSFPINSPTRMEYRWSANCFQERGCFLRIYRNAETGALEECWACQQWANLFCN